MQIQWSIIGSIKLDGASGMPNQIRANGFSYRRCGLNYKCSHVIAPVTIFCSSMWCTHTCKVNIYTHKTNIVWEEHIELKNIWDDVFLGWFFNKLQAVLVKT